MSTANILGVVGGVIGYIYGGPAGAQIGFTIGSAIGGYIDPTQIKGPQLSDATQQTSQEGIPIPFGYGTFPTTGNLIWAGPVNEHEHEDDGKGSGTVVTTYSYTRSYAIGICQGEISGLLKIKRNGKLVYDISTTSTIQAQNAKFLEKCTIYTGSETQLVDPTIEATEGVGATAPYRGLAYIVMEEDETQAGEVAQYEFVVQMCGTVTTVNRFLVSNDSPTTSLQGTLTGETWNSLTGGLSAAVLRFMAFSGTTVVASSDSGTMYYSADFGENWTATATVTPRNITGIAYGNGLFVCATSSQFVLISSDDGRTWVEHGITPSIDSTCKIAFGKGVFVLVAGHTGGTGAVYYGADGETWALSLNWDGAQDVAFNGSYFMLVGNSAACYISPSGATAAWILKSTIGGGSFSFTSVCGGPGVFLAAANASYGIYRTTDLGVSWAQVNSAGGVFYACASDGDYALFVDTGGNAVYSTDSGVTWAASSAIIGTTDAVVLIGGDYAYSIPDAPGFGIDEDGNVVGTVGGTQEISGCAAVLSDIVADLCDRAGIDSTEYDVSALTDSVAGFKCATESGADGFIEALQTGYFFDRGEWDKKVRFIKRGGASVAALTTDDLVEREWLAIEQTRIQEPELLRKVNIMTIDPAADYAMTKQQWERRAGTVKAKGESTIQIPVVCTADEAAQMAEKRGKVAWAETEKFSFSHTLARSYLTPTDVINVTDSDGKQHRIRLTDIAEDRGVFEVVEAVKDRASTYGSTAVGVIHENTGGSTTPGLVGHTLFVAMNLPQMREVDNTQGMYIGAAGMLSGWTGAQIFLSVDGGVSYSLVMTIFNPTIMGDLTADITASGTPLSVHVFGGTLSSKTAAQVTAGANQSAVLTGDTAEVLAYQTATETTAKYYDLTVLTRNIKQTGAAAHVSGDQFMDIASSYFLPIDSQYAGDTLYFKAVGFGISPDAVTASTFVYDPFDLPGEHQRIDGNGDYRIDGNNDLRITS
jgi:hypothetical protein